MARPRKPTKLKVVGGTDRPDRANPNEPMPEAAMPPPPSHLPADARRAWIEAAEIAAGMQVLTAADVWALEVLARAMADFRSAHVSLRTPLELWVPLFRKSDDETDYGPRVDAGICRIDGDQVFTLQRMAEPGERYYWTFGKSGPMRRQRPELADIADADRRIQSWVSKFGMTPADRSKVTAIPDAKANKFADLG